MKKKNTYVVMYYKLKTKKKTNNATKIFNNTSHINNLNSCKFNVNNKVTLKFSGLFLI